VRYRVVMAISASATPLETIPGVGPATARDLRVLGYSRVEDLAGEDPQQMYDALCERRGVRLDRCVLYVFRCATYYAGRRDHDPELLKWWRWKNVSEGTSQWTKRRSSRG
jgi:hypothetical protein